MATLDTSIALGGVPLKLTDPMESYARMQDIQARKFAIDKANTEQQHERTLSDLYRGNVNPDGSVNRAGVLQGAAGSGLGAKIPGMQKSFADADEATAKAASTKIGTQKTAQENLFSSMKMIDGAIASLAASPEITDNAVMSEMGRLVKMGAFNAQAEHSGKPPDDYAKEMLSTMPVGNPRALKQWLIQAGLRTADATKRLELMLPKYDEQNRGDRLDEGTIDQLTGKRTSIAQRAVSASADAQLSANTARRGQDRQAANASEANRIAKEAGQTQIIETPQGFVAVNKGTGMGRPVSIDGQPALGKDSSAAKNATMANNIQSMVPYAKTLLKGGPTGSFIGSQVDRLLGATGQSTKSSDTATKLETVAGWLTSNVPRFEGPQGVQDVIIYQTMAGMVGDRTKPVSARLAALESVERLMEQYSGKPGTRPATEIAPRPAVSTGTPTGRTSSPMRGGPAPAPGQRPSLDSFYSQ